MDGCPSQWIMRNLIRPYFLTALMLYLLIRVVRYLGVELPELLNAYAADLLCMPIILSIILFIVQRLKRNDSLALPLSGIIFVTAYWAIYFEYYLPRSSNTYTADALDVVMYIIGMLSFIVWQRRQGLESLRSFGI